jgi:hypothetical protein
LKNIKWDGELSREGSISSVSDIDKEAPNLRGGQPDKPVSSTAVAAVASTITEDDSSKAKTKAVANSMDGASTMERKKHSAQKDSPPAKEGETVDLVDAALEDEDEGTYDQSEAKDNTDSDNTANAESEEPEAKAQPSGKNTIPNNENVPYHEATMSSSSSANANSNNTGMAGIDGRADQNYGTSGQNNSAEIAESSKNTIHPVAVKRIAAERQLNIQPYFAAPAKDHGENIF